jgi:hypothetical protein
VRREWNAGARVLAASLFRGLWTPGMTTGHIGAPSSGGVFRGPNARKTRRTDRAASASEHSLCLSDFSLGVAATPTGSTACCGRLSMAPGARFYVLDPAT